MKQAFVILATALSMSGAIAQTAASQPAASSAALAEARATQHEQRVEERIAFLHSALKITPEQATQWNAFADQMRSNAHTMADLYRQRSEGESSRNALDDMKQYAQLTQAHAEDMQKLVSAFEPLYNSFSPEQKALADKTFRHREAGGADRGRRPGHRGGKPHAKPHAGAGSNANGAAGTAEGASAPAAGQ
jgi:hypothetical protein